MTSSAAQLHIDRFFKDDAALIVPHGALELATYAQLRDALLKAALEMPRAVIVDVAALRVPTDATLTVFSSVWMQVSDWPGVPIVLVAARELDRRRIERTSITRYIPVYPSIPSALAAVGEPPARKRAVLELPHSPSSAGIARRFVTVSCTRWSCPELLPDAELIANELVENAVQHARSESRLRLELSRDFLTVAVYDDDPTPAQLAEPDMYVHPRLGLLLVAQLAKAWSCGPTLSGGKVVWAVLRVPEPAPEDRPSRRPSRRARFG